MSRDLAESGVRLPRGSVDLRRLIRLLISRWVPIVAVTVTAAGLAFACASSQPRVYEASTLIAITEPRRKLEFESLYRAMPQSESAYRSFALLAASHEVLENVVRAYRSLPIAVSETIDREALSPMVRVRPDDEARLVTLAVRSRSPQQAAAIANIWGERATAQANQVYGASDEHMRFLETELAGAAGQLRDAEQALADLRQRHRTTILSVTLASTLETYRQSLDDQQVLTDTIQEIRGVRRRLVTERDVDDGAPPDAVGLFLCALDEQRLARIHLPSQRLDALCGPERHSITVAFLDDLVADLEHRSDELDDRLSTLETRILAIRQALLSTAGEESALENARDAAKDLHLALARELTETRLAAREENRVARVAASAIVPERPVAPLTRLYVAVATIIGLTLSVSAVWAIAWWEEGRREGDPVS